MEYHHRNINIRIINGLHLLYNTISECGNLVINNFAIIRLSKDKVGFVKFVLFVQKLINLYEFPSYKRKKKKKNKHHLVPALFVKFTFINL